MDVYIAIGSNIDPTKNITRAINHLKEQLEIKKISPIYRSKPVGYLEQPDFLNAVIKVETNYAPKHLMNYLKQIEEKLKKDKKIKDGPRTIDLDIQLYGQIQSNDPIIPHPRMHQRRFVLQPLCDIDKEIMHPTIRQTAKQLLENCKDQQLTTFGHVHQKIN